ncbi:MAG: ECF transporter S component [Agathobacter sp.]
MSTSNSNATAKASTSISIKELTITAVCIALTYVFTWLVNIRLPFAPNGGLIHLGNVPLFLAAILFGRRTGALSGAIGMGLFDLLSGWTAWAPFTFVVVGAMGYTVGIITEKHRGFGWKVVAMIAALAIKIGGYYIAEVILYGNWVVPASSIPGNVLQVVTAAIVVLLVSGRLQVLAERMGLCTK